MAFLPTAPLPSLRSTRHLKSYKSSTCTATTNRPSKQSSPSSRPRPRPHRTAPVIDSRISSVMESHHWIVVKPDRRRIFERAAVAHADMTRLVERRTGVGSSHRWVLREEGLEEGRYVVMETFKRQFYGQPQLAKRWLTALERVASMMRTIDIRTRDYQNLFTTKLHDVSFDPNRNIVVVESINVERGVEKERVEDVLRNLAEMAIGTGDCLEFCVLKTEGSDGFYKTVEVYKDKESLEAHMDGLDIVFRDALRGKTASGQRNRHIFRPVVFA